LSELHVVGRSWKALGAMERFSREMELFGRLRARRYDLLVHLSEQPRGAWLARTLGARYSVAPATPGRGRFWAKSFTHLFPVVGGGRRHQVELNLDALRRVGVQPSLADRKVVFVPGKQAEARASRLAPEGFIHMHPASRWTFKCWPAEKNAELIDRFASEGHQVVLTSAGDPAELDMVQKIVALAKAKTISLAGTLSIKELGALTARARLFVGVDSMPMHLAAAMGTPTSRRGEGWGARRLLRVDPFHVGNLWRDWSFARAARTAWRRESFDIVQSHERIPGCDIYRAGDGVHRRWLELRQCTASVLERIGIALNPYHRYVCSAEKHMFEHPRLLAVICNSRMVRDEVQLAFCIGREKRHVI